MAAFKYKDLMITVGSNPAFFNLTHCVCFGYSWAVTYRRAFQAAEELYLGGGITPAPRCLYRTEIFMTLGCPARSVVEVAGPVPYPGPGPEDLAAVKVQLQQALADIEKQERAAAESAEPQTAAEVESLQTKLHEAISELEKRKQELRRESQK
jgi:hypothetical protein